MVAIGFTTPGVTAVGSGFIMLWSKFEIRAPWLEGAMGRDCGVVVWETWDCRGAACGT